MIHYGIVFLVTLAVIGVAYLKMNKWRWFIGLAGGIYLLSFLVFQVTISTGHDYIPSQKQYAYILVFGGGVKSDGRVKDAVTLRLDKAMEADPWGNAVYLLSGGLGTDLLPDEAVAMADYLIGKGVPEERILYEKEATSTWENLIFSKAILAGRGDENLPVLGVSSDFHMQRIGFLKDRIGFVMDLLPAKTPWYARMDSMPREYFATIKSLLFDWPHDQDVSKKVVYAGSPSLTQTQTDLADDRQILAHEHEVIEISLAAVGDIMVHRSQLLRADGPEGFDFSPSFKWVKPMIDSYDYAIANLETTLAGEDGQRKIRVDQFYKGYSGYPVFNAPDILVDNLKESGFDLLATANNHTLDSKETGLLRTLDVLDAAGIAHLGTYRTKEEQDRPFVVDVEGITFGILNYTYAMNGFWTSAEEDYMVNHLGNYKEDKIEEMYHAVEKMAERAPDFVVVILHYGIEYVPEPDGAIQQPLVDGLFDHGADIILGGHPHVLQPFEVREVVRPDGEKEQGIVIYSLGNFISSQRYRYTSKDTDYGLIFAMDFRKVDDRKPTVEGLRLTPTYVYWSQEDLEIITLLEVPEALVLGEEDRQRLTRGREVMIPHLLKYWQGDWDIQGSEVIIDLDTSRTDQGD